MNTLCGMVVLPYQKMYKMDIANDFFRSYIPPLGVLRVTIVSGRGFAIENLLLKNIDIPDVYCNISFGGQSYRSSTVKDHQCPEWNESFDFVLCDYNQILEVHAWDEDVSPLDPDDDLGAVKLSVAEILRAGSIKEVELLNPKTNNATGSFVTLRCDVLSFTSTDLWTLQNPSRNENHLCGILTILISKALDLPGRKEDAASYVQVWIGKNNPYRSIGSFAQPLQPPSDVKSIESIV
jgi:Ca2+-dependent lipid-binding protein